MLFESELVFEKEFKKHYKWLVGVAARIINDSNTAEDLVQETFIALWEKRNEIELQGSLQGYLRTAVVNRSLNYLRGKVKFTGEEINEHKQWVSDATHLADAALLSGETENKVNRVISQLPEAQRLVFILSRFEEMSYREIAERLNISIKTVEKHMTSSLKQLRKYLPVLGLVKLFLGLW